MDEFHDGGKCRHYIVWAQEVHEARKFAELAVDVLSGCEEARARLNYHFPWGAKTSDEQWAQCHDVHVMHLVALAMMSGAPFRGVPAVRHRVDVESTIDVVMKRLEAQEQALAALAAGA